MTITLGGQYSRWNDTLLAGFWQTVISVSINGVGYVCFAACMAEMAGTLPFSGGIYGFVRAFLGPFSGFIVSRFEIIMVICYVASLVLSLGTFPTLAGISSKEVEPAWWLLYFVTATGIALLGCDYKEYWMFIRGIGGLSLLLLVMFILGSFGQVNYDVYAGGNAAFKSDLNSMPWVYGTAGMFHGMQYLPLVSIKLADVSCYHNIVCILTNKLCLLSIQYNIAQERYSQRHVSCHGLLVHHWDLCGLHQLFPISWDRYLVKCFFAIVRWLQQDVQHLDVTSHVAELSCFVWELLWVCVGLWTSIVFHGQVRIVARDVGRDDTNHRYSLCGLVCGFAVVVWLGFVVLL